MTNLLLAPLIVATLLGVVACKAKNVAIRSDGEAFQRRRAQKERDKNRFW